jgi:hypothetical protein
MADIFISYASAPLCGSLVPYEPIEKALTHSCSAMYSLA